MSGIPRRWRGAVAAVAALLLPAGLLAAWSGGAEQLPYRDPPGFLLSDVTGIASEGAAGPMPSGTFGRATSYLTVNIDADGRAYLADDELRIAKPWRGTNLPVDAGPQSLPVTVRLVDEIDVHINGLHSGEPRFRIRNWRTDSTAELIDRFDKLGRIGSRYFGYTVDAAPNAPFDWVADAIATGERFEMSVEFRPLPLTYDVLSDGWRDTTGYRIPEAGRWDFDQLLRRLREEAILHPENMPGVPGELSGLGMLIRADARAPWSSVAEVLTACSNARVWRVAFAARRDGREVVLGRVTRKPTYGHGLERVDPGGGYEAIADIPLGNPPTPPGFKVAPSPPGR